MPVAKPCVLWKDLGLFVRIISIEDPLSDMKQKGSLTRFLSQKHLIDQTNDLKCPYVNLVNQY